MNKGRSRSLLRRVAFVTVVLGCLIAAGWVIYRRVFAAAPGIEPDPSLYSVRGVDLSAHNGEIDFASLADEGIEFVMLKATEGTDFKDRRFVDNYRLATAAGLKVGAYHFFRFDTDGRMQALNLLHSVRNRNLDFPLVIDIEEWGNPDAIATSAIIARLRDMIAHLGRYGYEVMLYTNKDGYDRFVKGNFDSYPLWLCSFTEIEPDVEWDMWQYTHHGRVSGVAGLVDLNTLSPEH